MKVKLIKKDEIIGRRISKSYEVKNIITKELTEKVSLAISEAKDHFEITKNVVSDRIYYLIGGQLIIKEGNKMLVVNKGDAIFIPANSKYQFEGTFEAILINSPSFNPNNEKIQEIK